MKRDMDKTFVDKYWPVALLFVPVLLYFLINGVGGGDGDDDGKAGPQPIQVNVEQVNENELEAKLMHAQPKKRMTLEEKTRETIGQHAEKLQDPAISTEDHQALLLASGNLYMVKLNDCKRASSYYLQYIDAYPDGNRLSQAYIQLLTCYETLKDEANTRATLRRMMDAFPNNTPEYQLAQQKLEKGEIDPPTREIPQAE